jgi:transcription elongation factor Elf1
MKANVILMKCPKERRTYGVRIEENCGDWYRTWAFPMDEGRASREGYDKTKITGNLMPTHDFNGCPYCGTKEFVQCGRCGKLSCWNKEERITCGWCGLTGDITTTTDAINVKSGDM